MAQQRAGATLLAILGPQPVICQGKHSVTVPNERIGVVEAKKAKLIAKKLSIRVLLQNDTPLFKHCQ